MTAATLTPDALVTWGREVLEAADKITSQWVGVTLPASAAIARQELRDAIEIYGDLDAGRYHPASEYPELAGHPEAGHEALRLKAGDVRDWGEELVRLFPAAAVEPVP